MSSSGQILGTYDLERKVEDTLIILESTIKNYGDLNRAVVLEEAILEMIDAKISVNPSDRYALITYGEKVKKIIDFDDWDPKLFKEKLYNDVEILGTKAYLIDGLMNGFQILANSMMKIFEGKQFRILLITEGHVDNKPGEPDWNDLVDKCEKIGIFIDVVQINDKPHRNFIKSLALRTRGEYIECPLEDAVSYIQSLAPRKKIASINQSEKDRNMTAFLEIIAQPLVRMETKIKKPKDLLKFVTAEDDSTKCAICHSQVCMICKGPSYACGAYCPNCDRFVHEHCFAAWAENSKDTPPSIGKCPICFGLLKVPGAIFRVKVLQAQLKGKLEFNDNEKYRVEKLKAKDLGIKGAQIECLWCYKVFNADEDIIKCGNPNCNAYYHYQCFNNMINHTKNRCRLCDTLQSRGLDAHPALQKIA